MNYVYETMKIEDYNELYELWMSTPGMGLSDADNRENIDAYLTKNPGQSFICRLDGKIVGSILCGNDARRAYIHHTAVDLAHRRRGVGVALVRCALEAQQKLGIEKCHLFIFNTNTLGRAFGEAQGFIWREDISVMSRNL